jgi:hypothetical protein
LIIAVLLINSACFAQVGGAITGVIKDPTDAAIPSATVSVTNTATGALRTATTDSQGVYSFPALAVGQYELEADAPGFLAQRRTGLVIDVNGKLQVDIKLELAGRSETVTVSEEADQVHLETADTQLGQTVESQRIEEVPLNGRSYTDLLAAQTGVTPVTTSATSSTSSGGGFGAIAPSGGLDPGAFSVNGQRESANGFILNGANVEESVAESAAIIPNLDSISEFRVLTSNFDAEYGNYSGGLVSVVTKSGTNDIHGLAFEFLRNTDLDARGFFDPTRAPFIQNQFGAPLAGQSRRTRFSFSATTRARATFKGSKRGCFRFLLLRTVSGTYWTRRLR